MMRSITSQEPGLEGSEWLGLVLVPVVLGLALFFYLKSTEDLNGLAIVLTLSYFGWLVIATRKKWDWIPWVILLIIFVAIGSSLSWEYRDILHDEQRDSVSTTIRNLGLVIGGGIAILLAVWRSIVAERQADTARESLLNESYQKGAEMLGNDILSVRLGGIYALERLAAESPDHYHIQVMKLFCAFVVQTSQERCEVTLEGTGSSARTQIDTQAIMDAIRNRKKVGIRLERTSEMTLELGSAYLEGLDLRNADLTGANLMDANLSRAELAGADLYHATLLSTNLTGTSFVLEPDDEQGKGKTIVATGLTQASLDGASADPDKKPILEGVVDAETGQQLVWHCKPCQ